MNGNYPTDPVLITSERTAFFMQQQYALRNSRLTTNPVGTAAAHLQNPDVRTDARSSGEQALAKDAINQTFGNGSQSKVSGNQRASEAFAPRPQTGAIGNGRPTEARAVGAQADNRPSESKPAAQISDKKAVTAKPDEKPPFKKHTPPKQLQRESAAKFQEFRSRPANQNAWLPDVSFFDPAPNESVDYYCPVACDIDKPVKRSCSYAKEGDYLDMMTS